MIQLVAYTAVAIFTAEALIMLMLESLRGDLSLFERTILDSTLLMICVIPTLYLLVFREMAEQIGLRRQAEQAQNVLNQSLELLVEERTGRLQRANEDLLIEVQERAKTSIALRKALNEARNGKEKLQSIIDAVRDSLVVVNEQWEILVVNRAAEEMFRTNGYDLVGKSLKDYLLPWSKNPVPLDDFFCSEKKDFSMYTASFNKDNDVEFPIQMNFGAEIEWEGSLANVLTLHCRDHLESINCA